MADVGEVAKWMLEKLNESGELDQAEAVDGIEEMFGRTFVYENENGNLAIKRDVLRAFRELTESAVVWDKDERLWRRRESSDEPGRQQD